MKVKKILFSQPLPVKIEKTPYYNLIKNYNVSCVFEKFIKIEGVPAREFRADKIYLQDYTAAILTSRNAIDHLFRMAKEMRYEVPETMKYFCNSESTAFYLQRYIQYRKRKVFHGRQTNEELLEIILKHKDEKFLMPCSDVHKNDISDMLDSNDIKYQKAILYKTVSSDIKHLNLHDYDMVILFTPSGVKSLFENFPDFEQGNIIFGGFGAGTMNAITDAGLRLDVPAPTDKCPSMTMAIEDFLRTHK